MVVIYFLKRQRYRGNVCVLAGEPSETMQKKVVHCLLFLCMHVFKALLWIWHFQCLFPPFSLRLMADSYWQANGEELFLL